MEIYQFYIVYDEFTITVCSCLDDAVEELALGSKLYGFTDDENMAQKLLRECFHFVSSGPM
ncbi:hypothetical protein CBW46_018860 [Paenibacillus xerothermodurans]|uniref:Uncharacterized protein n=1 Tax=Paenibacillus xerothermodurans TaxID=1977292 RepID=A0A2W1NK25_PAEXE|nr:hypothetical protein CBW46_018860 [Paenibacillus xerothermodurans]